MLLQYYPEAAHYSGDYKKREQDVPVPKIIQKEDSEVDIYIMNSMMEMILGNKSSNEIDIKDEYMGFIEDFGSPLIAVLKCYEKHYSK